MSEKYLAAKARGACPNCGKPASDGMVYCAKCHARRRFKYEENKKNRRCPGCGKPAGEKYIQCESCREIRAEAKRIAAQRKVRMPQPKPSVEVIDDKPHRWRWWEDELAHLRGPQ